MRDGRELWPAASFGELGFELRSWPTSCADFDDADAVVKTYYSEVIDAKPMTCHELMACH